MLSDLLIPVKYKLPALVGVSIIPTVGSVCTVFQLSLRLQT